jgi:hypothetical protein
MVLRRRSGLWVEKRTGAKGAMEEDEMMGAKGERK